MNNIPYYLREQMALQTILLHKKEKGWDKIHRDILFPTLYVKKTPYVFNEHFYFEKIIRAKTRLYFRKYKKYNWLTRMKENSHMYYYEPIQYKCKYNIHDLFSTNYYPNLHFLN